MSEWVTGLIETVGYAGIALLMVLEILVPVVQSEIVMTFSGFAAERGERLTLTGVVLAGVAGSQAGSMLLYGACRRLPAERVRGFVADHGGWLGLTREGLEKAERRFDDHSGASVLVGRLLPGLRGFIAVPAGLVDMPAGRFFLFNLLGAASWTTALAVLGYLLGTQYRLVDQYSSWVTTAFVGTVAALVAVRVVKVRRRRQRQDA